jgi:hypothetical protein
MYFGWATMVQRMGAMEVTEAVCPRCKSTRTSRQKRVGVVQLLLSKLGYFPWECGGCRLVFTAKNRGKVKRKRRSEGEIHLPPVG